MICRWLESHNYKAEETSYENFCDVQIVSSVVGRGGLEIYKADEMSYLISRVFQIHQRLRTYGVETSTRQRRMIFNPYDVLCSRLEKFKADFEVLDRCYSWVLEVCKHFFSETYQDYAIFLALASWSVAASCLVVSFLGQFCISRSTTTGKLCLLLAKYQITAPFDTRHILRPGPSGGSNFEGSVKFYLGYDYGLC
eukprot:scaffold2620_cov97-Cylindrotheca_fusiformis.AAC.1